ncbi:MAG: DUF4332 domain-containing protein [Planctomycetota bacterium]
MIRWNPNSNVADVLSLGPRTAGRLASVGVRTAGDLLAASPDAIAARLQMDPALVRQWRCEAALILELPGLPGDAARLLAAIGIASGEQLQGTTPLELIARIEAACRQAETPDWLSSAVLPSPEEAASWITCLDGRAPEKNLPPLAA